MNLWSRVTVTNGSELDGLSGQVVEIVDTDMDGNVAKHSAYPKYRVSIPLRGSAFVFYSWELDPE